MSASIIHVVVFIYIVIYCLMFYLSLSRASQVCISGHSIRGLQIIIVRGRNFLNYPTNKKKSGPFFFLLSAEQKIFGALVLIISRIKNIRALFLLLTQTNISGSDYPDASPIKKAYRRADLKSHQSPGALLVKAEPQQLGQPLDTRKRA